MTPHGRDDGATVGHLEAATHELATPIGDGHLALMTAPGSTIRRGAELDVQLTNGPLSSEHWNVEFGSVDENVKTGFA